MPLYLNDHCIYYHYLKDAKQNLPSTIYTSPELPARNTTQPNVHPINAPNTTKFKK